MKQSFRICVWPRILLQKGARIYMAGVDSFCFVARSDGGMVDMEWFAPKALLISKIPYTYLLNSVA